MSIIQNAIQIVENWPEITYLVSSHVHHFNTYIFKDGTSISCDGGLEYIKRSGDRIDDKYATKWMDWSLDDKIPFDTIKERLLWGSYGKFGGKNLIYKLIKDLELSHLKNILKENNKEGNDSSKCVHNLPEIHLKVIKYWIKEKEKLDDSNLDYVGLNLNKDLSNK